MPMSIRYVSLKALHRSHSPRSETPDRLWHGRLLKDEGGLLPHARLTRTDRGDQERLAQILGGTAKTNKHGDYVSVHCSSAQPARYLPDARALQLLVPEAPDETADRPRWLYPDQQTPR